MSLPFPPSVNRMWRSVQGRNILSAAGREYRKAGLASLDPQRLACWPRTGRLSVSVTLCPPDARRRDVDNYLKAVLDLLTHGGVYVDDSQIDRLTITRGPVEKGGRVIVEVYPL
ncbi:RusA family crossover junction endodeoxyribonuclease [Deinococcus sp. DB0503]|nr:RusA family crossover junction endodeoxyribonuclease [Deinococcus sp. DB0503]TDE85356.1 RusA family crossover junction endodeoxyribonuclease [Deinococcus sp. S9]